MEYSHNFRDDSCTQSAQVQVLKVQIDGNWALATLRYIDFINAQRLHRRNR